MRGLVIALVVGALGAGCASGVGSQSDHYRMSDGGHRDSARPCGAETESCCPDGSCGDGLVCTVGGTCAVGTPPVRDAGFGAHDAGPPAYDAGSAGHDAGLLAYDAGIVGHDAGPPAYDAGPPVSSDPCASIHDCFTCTSAAGCGYCLDVGGCWSGSLFGPDTGSCAWAWEPTACLGF